MQQINLYRKNLRKKVLIFSFQKLMHSSIALIIVLALVQIANEFHYHSTQAQLNVHVKLLIDKTNKLNTFQASLPKVKKDLNLEVKLQKMEAELINKQTVLTVLSNKKLGNTDGFTQHFEGLARQTIKGLWITRAHFIQGGTILDIQGESNHPDLVPKYLQALSSEQAFKGSEFNSFIINKNEKNNALEFKFNNISSSSSKTSSGLNN